MTDRSKVTAYAQRAGEYPLPDAPHAVGRVEEPSCKDELVMGFRTHREIVTEIGFTLTPSACPPLFACATTVVELVKGKPVLEAFLLKTADIAAVLSTDGILDAEHVHCALMAELALKRMITAYSEKKKAALKGCR
ncbi:iron-sulfur cluster assembly scaffold protein [Eubacteriales bacterium OttesenSCG-928-A19]|nr:iron-sulfur cluster assembly scaffold protein [Eubacteriales bacterium OttesenSCG-928-A19]